MHSILTLKHLKHLDVSGLSSRCELQVLLEKLSHTLSNQLEVLNISKNDVRYQYVSYPHYHSVQVNKPYTNELLAFLQNATKLKVLMMNECYGNINDDVLRAIATNCPNLERLGVCGVVTRAKVIEITGREDIQVDS